MSVVSRRTRGGRAVLLALLALVGVYALAHATAARAAGLITPKMYWVDQGTNEIGDANLDGTGMTPSIVSAPFSFASAAAVDDNRIYWTDLGAGTAGTGTIGESGLAQEENNNTTLISDLSLPTAIAVDGSHIYWTEEGDGTAGAGSIGVATVSNGVLVSETQHLITGLTLPSGIAITGSHIYWVDQSPLGGFNEIDEASLDGGGETTLVPNIETGTGIAVDNSHIYFTFGQADIGVANLDGTDENNDLITTAGGLVAIAVDSQHIYWTGKATGQSGRVIGLANLDGTDINPAVVTGLSLPASLAVSPTFAQITASPQPFPATAQGTLSAPQTVTVSNTGTRALTLSGLTFSGDDPNDFIVSSNSCLGSVAPDQSCQITVNFVPQAVGSRDATLNIATSAIANSPLQVTLSGTGSAATAGGTGPAGPTGPAGNDGDPGPTGPAGNDGALGATGPTGPAGNNGAPGATGPIGSAGVSGAVGPAGPAGKVELVTCTTTKPKTGKPKTTCKTKLVSAPVKFQAELARTAARGASLRRARRLFASGTAASLGNHRVQLLLTPRTGRALPKGRYTLVLNKHGRQAMQRTAVTIR